MFAPFVPLLKTIPGDIAEVGVFQGNSAFQLATTFKGRRIHLFDTFSGMPESDPSIDTHKKGDFNNTSVEIVKEKLKAFSNIIYHEGLFPETAPRVGLASFAFVNVDVDLYSSMKACLDFFFPRLTKGGFLFIQDDYNFSNCKGVTKATDEFIKANNLSLLKKGSSVWIIK